MMACPQCLDSGWVVKTENLYSFAAPCPSCASRKAQPRPSLSGPTARRCVEVADLILANCSGPRIMKEFLSAWMAANLATDDELGDFMVYVLDNATEWKGIAGLALMLGDLRRKIREAEESVALDRRIEGWKQQAQLNPGVYEPLKLEAPVALKPMPEPVEKPQPVGIVYTDKDLESELAQAPLISDEERQRKAQELERLVLARARIQKGSEDVE